MLNFFKMFYLSGVLDFNCCLNGFSHMLYMFINSSTDYNVSIKTSVISWLSLCLVVFVNFISKLLINASRLPCSYSQEKVQR